jgi:hypothetical protein
VNPLLIILVGLAFIGAIVVAAVAYIAGVSDERAKWVRAYKADYEDTRIQCRACLKDVTACACTKTNRRSFS